ncbi:hypothetical protein BJ912DRAFT_926133 [Pholiota molesta]|nr:hypothetical protein BJ912DRAFT_926133 [Pholiota molesta]
MALDAVACLVAPRHINAQWPHRLLASSHYHPPPPHHLPPLPSRAQRPRRPLGTPTGSHYQPLTTRIAASCRPHAPRHHQPVTHHVTMRPTARANPHRNAPNDQAEHPRAAADSTMADREHTTRRTMSTANDDGGTPREWEGQGGGSAAVGDGRTVEHGAPAPPHHPPSSLPSRADTGPLRHVTMPPPHQHTATDELDAATSHRRGRARCRHVSAPPEGTHPHPEPAQCMVTPVPAAADSR